MFSTIIDIFICVDPDTFHIIEHKLRAKLSVMIYLLLDFTFYKASLLTLVQLSNHWPKLDLAGLVNFDFSTQQENMNHTRGILT